VGHRAEVDLNERTEVAILLVDERERRVRGERSLACAVLEGLACSPSRAYRYPLNPAARAVV
jgi:hypothetical protein